MKKLILILTFLLSLVLTACGEKEFIIKVETPISDAIVMDFEVGNDLFTDKSQRATLVKCTDGDTANFDLGSKTINIRFDAIDTPETNHPTKGIEPWGKAATQYTCYKLTNAKEIVLELNNGEIEYTYERLLAFVWVDGKLLNAQLVEIGLAQSGVTDKDQYHEDFLAAFMSARKQKLGVYGTTEDPNWDYKNSKLKDYAYRYKYDINGTVVSGVE